MAVTSVDIASTVRYDETLVAAFERTAAIHPDRIAVESDAHHFTYRELNESANRLAHRLLALGGSAEQPVAILMDHNAPAITACAGVLKAGRIVLGLSKTDPVARLAAILEDAKPAAIVTDDPEGIDDVARLHAQIVPFESAVASGPVHNPAVGIESGQTAALVYTSGATGRPKGVMQTHRQIRRNVAAHTEAMHYSEDDRIPLLSAIGSGHGTTGIWCALVNGATLCPFPVKVRGVTGLAEWIVERRLTVFISSASIFRTLAKTIDRRMIFTNIRAVRLSSESITHEDVAAVRRHFPRECMFVHTLASSETGNIAWHRWTSDEEIPEGRLPLGRPSTDIEVLLLGDDDKPVAPGEIGEIAVRSRYVANGYWRDPVLTAKRFSQDLDGNGTRIVRNGDRARIGAAGLLEFCGRTDDRIKIRGNRIELGDIESALRRLPGIREAAAVAVPRENHEPMLVAYVVLASGASWSVSRLRHAVSANLPFHMVPSRFVFVDRLPLGAGGKIDRNALRSYRVASPAGEAGEGPQTATEVLLADIWEETLDIAEVARNDDFFTLGGDSLKGAIVAAQIFSATRIEVTLSDFAANPTLSALAAFVENSRETDAGRPPLLPVARNGPAPLSLAQERAWKAAEIDPGFVCARLYRIAGPVDVKIFEASLADLVERHDILRTSFAVVDGRPAQIVDKSIPNDLTFIDVSDADDPEQRAQAICLREAARPIDVATPPLTRHLLVRLDRETHLLLRTTTALTQDGWSFVILMDELATLYEAKIAGAPAPLPRKTSLQYLDYAVWHRSVMQPDGPAYTAMLDWWKQQFPKGSRALKLPFRRSTPETGIDPEQGVIHWRLDKTCSDRLDAFARTAGATHFVVRLACFVALVADLTGRSTVVIATNFANRSRPETRNMVGSFANLVPMVFAYQHRARFCDWTATVRDRVFETEAHAEIPYEELYAQLRTAGLKPPHARIVFMIAAELDEQRFGGLTVTRCPYPVATMPWGCQVYIDERLPENCRVDFNASLYPRPAMQTMIHRYVRLLETAARHPDLSIGTLVSMSSDNSVRRAWAYGFSGARRTNRARAAV